MDRIRELSLYGKLLLLALVVMAVVFAVVYPVVTSREGYLYYAELLLLGTENGDTTYSATVNGKLWCFTVTPDKAVTFRCGDKQYGPYTAKEDPTAIPAGDDLAQYMTGVEIRSNNVVVFRGGVLKAETGFIIADEKGTNSSPTIIIRSEYDEPKEPSVSTILTMMDGPELTHKGHGGFWFVGAFFSLVTAVYILFADELFRWRMRFQVRDSEMVEPSELELVMRPVCWTVMVLAVLAFYMMGLKIGV